MFRVLTNKLSKAYAHDVMFNLEVWETDPDFTIGLLSRKSKRVAVSVPVDKRFLLDISSFTKDDLLPIAYRFLRRKGVCNYHIRLSACLGQHREVTFEKFVEED